jgi:hypothetical protein
MATAYVVPGGVQITDYVRDRVSGLEGPVQAVTFWRFGCKRITFQPNGSNEGKPHEQITVDEPQLEVITAPAERPYEGTHGGRPDVTRRNDPR